MTDRISPSSLRLEDQVRDLIDKTIERFTRLNVAVNDARAEAKCGPMLEQAADSGDAARDTRHSDDNGSRRRSILKPIGSAQPRVLTGIVACRQ